MRIVLLHGALGAADQTKPLAEELKKEGFTIEILELPGHGNTPLGEVQFSVKGFTNWLKNELEDKELKGLPFFGFSMGGYIALSLASQDNSYFKEIITLGTKLEWNSETAEEETKKLDPKKILEKVPKFAAMLDKRHQDWKKVMENTQQLMIKLGDQPIFGKEQAEKIENRVLIMRGQADMMVTRQESEQVAGWLKNGSYRELTAIPHPLEQVPPQQLAIEIKAFLK